MYEVENCFNRYSRKGGFPRIFPEYALLNNVNLDHIYFLRNAVYLGIVSSPFDEEGLEFLKAVLKEPPIWKCLFGSLG